MARSSWNCLALALAAVAWAVLLLGARADVDVIVNPQGGLYQSFPYCRCMKTTSAYSLAPQVTFKGNNTYCFTLWVRNCSASCCKVNLKKIEFDVHAKCAVRTATVRATLNGIPTKVGPNFYFPADGPAGSTVLRLTDLPLGLSDNGTEICITLLPSRTGAGCTTLEQLCAPPADEPAGVCRAALFNSNNSTNSCCPQSDTGLPPPPPPLPPASPSAPPPPQPCQQCLTVRLVPPPLDFPPFRFDSSLCAAIQASLSTRLNGALNSSTIHPLLVAFAADPSLCSPLEATVCGTFASVADAQAVQALLQSTTDLFAAAVADSVCPSAASGYSIQVVSAPGACVSVSSGFACDIPPNPFPNCRCNKTQGITPLYVQPIASVLPGRTAATALYCFTIGAVPEIFQLPSACGSSLSKVEIWADDSRRRNLTGIRVTPAGGSPSWKAVTWGANGDNSLRVTPLSWSFSQAVGGEVCLELAKSVALQDFCMGSGGCYLSLFNDAKNCCPAFPASAGPITIPA